LIYNNIKIEEVYTHDYSCNRYIVYCDESDTAVVIDPGCNARIVISKLNELNKKLGAILLTHAHYDHIQSVSELKRRYGAHVYLGERDMELIESDGHLAWYFRKQLDAFEVDVRLTGGVYDVCGFVFEAIPTPGHTHGAMTFVIGDNMFSGDTIFFETYGRTDLQGSDLKELTESAKRLFALKGDYKIFCGHGKNTSLSHERKHNPIIGLF